MSSMRIIVLTTLAMLAFASNSVLVRMALQYTTIDAASFTTIRLVSGALVLLLVARIANKSTNTNTNSGSWWSAVVLFVYAAGFSFAYVSLSTATGALLLFGAVQGTMIFYGLWVGERLSKLQWAGLVLAFAGVLLLFLPGFSSTPPLFSSLLMIAAGVCWGVYSLRGKGVGDPVRISAGNFTRAVVFTLILSGLMLHKLSLDIIGVCYALASGALMSGLGYVIWYRVMPQLKAIHAAIVQLSVPVIAALGGIAFLGESITLRLALASSAILSGITLVLIRQRSAQSKLRTLQLKSRHDVTE